MAYISARSVYLIITFIIVVLFGITGAYYYLDLKKNINITNKIDVPQQYNQEFQTANTTPEPTISSQLAVCQQTCQFSFHCQGDLECLGTDGTKKCVNPTCPSATSCICNLDQEATPSAENQVPSQYNSEPSIGGLSASPTPTTKPSAKPTIKPSPKPTPKPTMTPTASHSAKTLETYNSEFSDDEYSPVLPEAGLPFVSIAMLIFASFVTAMGLIWLHKQPTH